MLISPPFLPPRAEQQSEDEWLDLAMNGDAPGRGAFPVSFNLGWHGGIHLTAPRAANAHEPVRAIADGTIVFVRPPTKGLPNLPPEHPLMYNGATSDGVVVIRHEAEIGEGEQARVVFFSLYMHLHAIAPAARVNRFVHRKEVIGNVGYIDGEMGRMHFEIICDDANLARLTGRASGPLPLTSDGRSDVIFGEIHFHMIPRLRFLPSTSPPVTWSWACAIPAQRATSPAPGKWCSPLTRWTGPGPARRSRKRMAKPISTSMRSGSPMPVPKRSALPRAPCMNCCALAA
jgi:hydroxyethylthiazole kinase